MELIEQFSKLSLGNPATHLLSQIVDVWPWSRFCETYGDLISMPRFSFDDKHPIFGYLMDKLGLLYITNEFSNSNQNLFEEFVIQVLENTSEDCEYFEDYTCKIIQQFLNKGCKFPTMMLLSECDPKQEILLHEIFDYRVRGKLLDYFQPTDVSSCLKKIYPNWKKLVAQSPDNFNLNNPVTDRVRLSVLKYYTTQI